MRFYYAGPQQQLVGPCNEKQLRALHQRGILTGADYVIPERGNQWFTMAELLGVPLPVQPPKATPPPLPAAAQRTGPPPIPQSGPPPIPTQQAVEISTHVIPSVLVTMFGFFPCGAIALYHASRVAAQIEAGHPDEAKRMSRRAAIWCWIGFAAGLILWITVAAGLAILHFSNSTNAAS